MMVGKYHPVLYDIVTGVDHQFWAGDTQHSSSICWHIELFKTASWSLSTVTQWRLRMIGAVSCAFLFRLAGANYESCQPPTFKLNIKAPGSRLEHP